jgi:hypothetical protein
MVQRAKFEQIPAYGGKRTETIPSTNVVSGTQGLEAISQGLFSLSESLDKRRANRVAFASTLAGSRAGATGETDLQDPDTIAGMSYNQAAMTAYSATAETRARAKIKDIYSQFHSDPAQLKTGLDAYSSATLKTMQDVAPDLAPAFGERFRTWAQPYLSRAADNYKSDFTESFINDAQGLEAESIKDINQSSADLFSNDPVRSQQALAAVTDHIATLRRSMTAQALAGSVPTPEQLDARDTQVFQNAIGSGAKSWFANSPDKVDAFIKFKTGELSFPLPDAEGKPRTIKLSEALSPQAQAGLNTWMEQELAFSVQNAETAATMSEKFEQRERDVSEFNAWSLVYEADPAKRLTPQQVAGLVNARRIDPVAGKEMLSQLSRDDALRDNGATVMGIENKIYAGMDAKTSINKAFASGEIKTTTASRLLGLNHTEQNRGVEADKPRDRFRKLLHEATRTKGEFSDILGGEPERRARALMEYDQMTLDEGIEPKDAFEDVLARAKVSIDSINVRTEAMILPRFTVGGRANLDVDATAKRMRAEFDAGRMPRAELMEELRRLKEWEQALRVSAQDKASREAKKRKP